MICKHCNKQFEGKSFCTKYRQTYCEWDGLVNLEWVELYSEEKEGEE